MFEVPAYDDAGQRTRARKCPACGNYEDEEILINRMKTMGAENLTEEQRRERQREWAKKWRENLTPEQHEKLKQQQRESFKRRYYERKGQAAPVQNPDTEEKKKVLAAIKSVPKDKPVPPSGVGAIYLQLRQEIAKEIIAKITSEFCG